MSFSSKEGEFDRFFNRLDRSVEESRPDRQPDRFPSLPCNQLRSQGAEPPCFDLETKEHDKENTTTFALQKQFFCSEMVSKVVQSHF